MRYVVLIVSLAAFSTMLWSDELFGCARVPRHGDDIGINAEEAIIIYDTSTRMEHFIRRADFRTQLKDFGFLVPTPTQPELGEVTSNMFNVLQSATIPRRVFSGRVHRIVVKDRDKDKDGAAAPRSKAPEILDRQRVAGYDAIVLRAEDENGLQKWLADNKYDASPAVMDWLQWYVQHKWIITGFKVASDGPGQGGWNMSVRMSFETDKPYYPYREPVEKSPRNEPRSLRVYFLADARFQGTLGRDGAWPGRTAWSNACPKETFAVVTEQLKLGKEGTAAINARAWHLTEFEDHSSPRPGTDEVYFTRAADQSIVERIEYYDKYEYVYEEKAKTAEGSDRATLWYIVLGGGCLVGIVGLCGAFLIASRRRQD